MSGGAQLQQQALAKIACAHAGRIELLNDREHRLHLRAAERRHLGVALLGLSGDPLIHPALDLVKGTGEIAIVGNVADEVIGQHRFTRREVEQRQLLREVVREMLGVDRDGLEPLALLVLLPLSSGLEAIEQHGFPIDVVVSGLLRLRLDRRLRLGQVLRFRNFVLVG